MGVGTEERNSDTAEGEGQRAEFRGPPPQSAKAFFSQLDWRGVGGDTGYTAYETDSDSDGSSSSSEEDEMINDTSGGAGLRQPQLNHRVCYTLLMYIHVHVHVWYTFKLCTRI